MLFGLPFPLFLLLCTAVTVVGAEHSDGALRLKVIAGCSRLHIAGAVLVLACLTGLASGLLFLVPFWMLIGKAVHHLPLASRLSAAAALLALFLAVSISGSLLALLLRKPAAAACSVIGLIAVLALPAGAIDASMLIPQYMQDSVELPDVRTDEGDPMYVTRVYTNPFYLDSPRRELLMILNKLNPAEHTFRAYALFCSADDIEEMERSRVRNAVQREEWIAAMQQDGVSQTEIHWRVADFDAQTENMLEECYGFAIQAQDEVKYAPQCMLAILIAASAAGLWIFRRRDLL